ARYFRTKAACGTHSDRAVVTRHRVCFLRNRDARHSYDWEAIMLASTHHPLLTRTAADLMTPSVLLLPKEMSLRTAAHLLSRANISGAPVVDDAGRCIGVLSSTDFVHYAERDRPTRAPTCDCAIHAWQIIGAEVPHTETVESLMTKNPVTVPPSAK